MFIGRPPGNYDRILDFSRAVTGNLFFVPTATFLEDVASAVPAAAQPATPPPADAIFATRPADARSFARHRLAQRGTPPMNNLHRELAPISRWRHGRRSKKSASRTLKRYLAGRRVVDLQGPNGVRLSAVGTGHLQNITAPG